MRKIYFLLVVLAAIFVSCQNQTVPVPVDIAAEEAAVNSFLDSFYAAMFAPEDADLNKWLADDMMACGSDPSEFWNKQQIIELWTAMSEGMDFEIVPLGERVVRISQDGHSAFSVEQYFIPMYSSKLPFRNTFHMIKSNGEWKVFLANTAIIPKNEELPILDAALNSL